MSADGWAILLLVIFILGFIVGYRMGVVKAFAEGFSQGEAKGKQHGHEQGQYDGLKAGLRAEMIQALQKLTDMPTADNEVEKMRIQVQQELLTALQNSKTSEKSAKNQINSIEIPVYGWVILFIVSFGLAYLFL
jgi:hypothetical protein